MVELEMATSLAFTEKERGKSHWRIGSRDKRQVCFPPSERICELWRKHMQGYATIEVKKIYENCLLATIPVHTHTDLRSTFVTALGKETNYA